MLASIEAYKRTLGWTSLDPRAADYWTHSPLPDGALAVHVACGGVFEVRTPRCNFTEDALRERQSPGRGCATVNSTQ